MMMIGRELLRRAATTLTTTAVATNASLPAKKQLLVRQTRDRVFFSAAAAAAAAKTASSSSSSSSSLLSRRFEAKVTATPFNDAVVLESEALASGMQTSGLTTPPSRDEKPMGFKLSYAELARAVDAFANGVREVGIGRGDVVLSLWDGEGSAGTTSLEYTYVQLGCAKAGVTLAVMDSAAGITVDAVAAALQATKAKVLILPSKAPFKLEALLGSVSPKQWGAALELDKAPALQIVIQNGEAVEHEVRHAFAPPTLSLSLSLCVYMYMPYSRERERESECVCVRCV